MIKKYRLILITAFALIATVCLFAGCQLSINKSFDDFVNENQIKSHVTYILNEGSFANGRSVFNMYYPADAKPYEITQNTPAVASIANAKINNLTGHDFLGWYLAETNDKGVPYYEDGTLYDSELAEDEKKAVKATETKFDFSKPLTDGDDIYLVAKWYEHPKVIIKLIPDGFTTMVDKDDKPIKDSAGNAIVAGSVLNSYYIPESGWNGGEVGKYVFETDGYTFLSFHASSDGGEEFDGWPVMRPEETAPEKDVTVYAKYLAGDWEIVRKASDFEKLFRSGGNLKNYYFKLDGGETEIDCSSFKNISALAMYGGKIAGNNCTIKNLTVTTTVSVGEEAALFGKLTSTAEIKDVTFENLTLNYTIARRMDASAYFFCSNIEQGATFQNVTVGGQMEITLLPASVLDDTTQDNWLFGLAPAELSSGITVSAGTKCTVHNLDGTTTEYEV